jgi:hypothetical protein
MILFALLTFFSEPAPLDMPRAESYLVKEDGEYRLEDRYVKTDLWVSRTVIGRWMDDDGRLFTLSRLDTAPPPVEMYGTDTRVGYVASEDMIDKDDRKALRRAIGILSPVAVAEKPVSPRQGVRGYDDIHYWQGTNTSALVCAFLPEKGRWWYLAVWELADGDGFDASMKIFESRFLASEPDGCADGVLAMEWKRKGFWRAAAKRLRKKSFSAVDERELLRNDARRSVAAYSSWRATDGAEFTVLDDLGGHSEFLVSLTNDMSVMRKRYRDAMPSPLFTSNVLSVARIYASRADYLDAVGTNMTWTQAYWSPLRRELVAYLPFSGERELMKTIRHEAFHQYLSYATSMISASPWLNEGYAQYFEDESVMSWGTGITPTLEFLENAAAMLPSLFMMDYDEFYSGDDYQRYFKYRLAWSVAWFMEHGAAKVRFEPFKDLKRDYIASLLECRDMRKATFAAFGTVEKMDLFCKEWLKYWKDPKTQ